jgi:ABC-type multidrug transport system fused ATPase/permease subunit
LQVLVLDQGKIAEFDSPHTLLQDRSSIFFGLCKATGRKEFAELQRMAAASAGAS